MEGENQELLMFVKSWHGAIVTNNTELIDNFISHDWTILGYEGFGNRASLFTSINSGAIVHHKIETDKMSAVIYGDTGIVTSRSRYIGVHNGENFDLYDWSVCVLIREDGKWQCVSTTITPANNLLNTSKSSEI